MANLSGSIGGLLQGFNQTYWPAMRQNEAMALQRAQEERAKAMQDFQMQKYAESEAKDRQAAGLYAGMLGIKPTTMTPRTEDEIYADANAAGDFMGIPTTTEQANPQYEQFLAGGAKAGADMVKMTREQQLAELKARQDAWKERVAQQNADNQSKRLDAILARAQAGGGKGGKPVLFMDEQNRPVYLRAGEDIPAGWRPYDKKAEGNATKSAQAQQDKMANAELVLEDIRRVSELADKPFTLGFGATAVSEVPGTPAADLARLLDGIKANIGFDKLQAMRAASPTGGSLGQVSDMENKMLQATLGSLQQSQSPSQFKATLKRLETQYQDIVHGKGNRPNAVMPARSGGIRVYNPQTRRLE